MEPEEIEIIKAYNIGKEDENNRIYDNKPENILYLMAYNYGRVDAMLGDSVSDQRVIELSYKAFRQILKTKA